MFKKSVDVILKNALSGFNKAVEDLRDLAAGNQEQVQEIEEEIAVMQSEANALAAEGEKAHATADNIEQLMASLVGVKKVMEA